MAHGLESYCETVHSVAGLGGASGAARQFVKLTSRDLVIAIAFPRYHRDTIALAKNVSDRGLPLIALTDGPTSPLASLSEVALFVQTNRQRSSSSDASVLSLIQALCDSVAHRGKNSVQAASMSTESVLPWIHGSHSTAHLLPDSSGRQSQSERRKNPVKRGPSPTSKKEN
jgi:DNA-binding MurR/RpiR family transcriptional regulator